MSYMFGSASAFNQDISDWNVSGVTDMSAMFSAAIDFNQDIRLWNVSGVSDFTDMFYDSGLSNNKPLLEKIYCSWKKRLKDKPVPLQNLEDEMKLRLGNLPNCPTTIAKPTTAPSCPPKFQSQTQLRQYILNTANFKKDSIICLKNDNIDWNKVKSLKQLFYLRRAFNQDISDWEVSGVTDMRFMFSRTAFNQPLSKWVVDNVTSMNAMFYLARAFNQDISNWTVSGVEDMRYMFYHASVFNNNDNPLAWNDNVTNVKNMSYMFWGARAFNQDISEWNVSSVTDFTLMFKDSGLANDPEKTNLKKIYCSWKKRLEDKLDPLNNLVAEMRTRYYPNHLPKCDTTTAKPTTTAKATTTAKPTTETVGCGCVDLG